MPSLPQKFAATSVKRSQEAELCGVVLRSGTRSVCVAYGSPSLSTAPALGTASGAIRPSVKIMLMIFFIVLYPYCLPDAAPDVIRAFR